MTQATSLALGTTPVTSSTTSLASGVTKTYALYTNSGSPIPRNEGILVYLDTPGDNILLATLSMESPAFTVTGPVDLVFVRGTTQVSLGVVEYS